MVHRDIVNIVESYEVETIFVIDGSDAIINDHVVHYKNAGAINHRMLDGNGDWWGDYNQDRTYNYQTDLISSLKKLNEAIKGA